MKANDLKCKEILLYKIEPKFCDDFEVKEKKCRRVLTGWFVTKEAAKADYDEKFKIALNKLHKLLSLFEEIREKYEIDFKFGSYYEGDTYGIYEDGEYIEINVDKHYTFRFLQQGSCPLLQKCKSMGVE